MLTFFYNFFPPPTISLSFTLTLSHLEPKIFQNDLKAGFAFH